MISMYQVTITMTFDDDVSDNTLEMEKAWFSEEARRLHPAAYNVEVQKLEVENESSLG